MPKEAVAGPEYVSVTDPMGSAELAHASIYRAHHLFGSAPLHSVSLEVEKVLQQLWPHGCHPHIMHKDQASEVTYCDRVRSSAQLVVPKVSPASVPLVALEPPMEEVSRLCLAVPEPSAQVAALVVAAPAALEAHWVP